MNTVMDRFINNKFKRVSEEELREAQSKIAQEQKIAGAKTKVNKLSIVAGSVRLVPKAENFHLLGQHDQSTHGHGGGGGPSLDPNATGVARGMIAPPGHFSKDVEDAIRAAGHKVEDYQEDGKPLPGTDSWRDAHGISKEVYDARPIKRYTGSKDPVIEEMYPDPRRQKSAKWMAAKEDGIIMNRSAAPGAEERYGPVVAQIRPDERIVLDNRNVVRKTIELDNAIKRNEQVQKWGPQDVINERVTKLKDAEAELKKVQTQTPEEIRLKANQDKERTELRKKAAIKSGDEVRIAAADIADKKQKWITKDEIKTANLLEKDQKRAIGIAEQVVVQRQKALASVKANPEQTLKGVQDYSKTQIDKQRSQLDKTAVKYIFPKSLTPDDSTAARIEVNKDPQNIKNLVEGKGRVYFAMEGNIKADAVLTAVKREDPTAAVMSVPSVTTWPKTGETEWVAGKYLKGREVILIPDADGVHNRAVMDQATRLRGKLVSSGVDNVLVAAPPLIPGKTGKSAIDKSLRYPTGVKDERKGVDDHLGLGKGTLGDLTFNDAPRPKFDLTDIAKGKKIRSSAVPNMNRTLEAISDIAGPGGVGRISNKSLSQYTNIPESSVKGDKGSVKKLEKMGIIKIHNVFDPKLLGEGRREPAMDPSEIRRLTKLAGVSMPALDIKYMDREHDEETAAIIEIRDPKYFKKPGNTKNLASKYKKLKTSPGVNQMYQIAAMTPKRIVKTSEGAARYGVPIGAEIPAAAATGTIILSSSTDITGTIGLREPVAELLSTELHLIGQHDQSSHGGGGGSDSHPQITPGKGPISGVNRAMGIDPLAEEVFNQALLDHQNMSKGEQADILFYTEQGYHVTNRRLRNDREDLVYLDNYDSAFENHSTPTKGTTLYRGTHFENEDLKVGDIIQDKAFMSTTVSSEFAREFTQRRQPDDPSYNPVYMEIDTNENTSVISGAAREGELILNRGTPLRITDIEHCPDGICNIWTEVVDYDEF